MNGGLLDIRPPATAPEALPLVLLVAAGLLLLLGGLLWRHLRSPHRRARRRLKALYTVIMRDETERRDAAHTMARLLRQGLGEHGCRGSNEAFWQCLNEARFAPQPCTAAQLRALIDKAAELLEQRR